MFSFLLKQPSTLSTILHIAEYKIICAVSPPIPSQIFVLKGLANLLATMLLSSIAEWLTIVRRRKKNKEEEDRLVSLPPSLCKNFLPLISSFFSITKGSFHCCQLNESLCVLHPFPTHYSLSLTVSLAAAVSSSSSLRVSPFKYSFCENAVCFLQLRSLKEGSCFIFIFFVLLRSFMLLSRGLRGVLMVQKMLFSWSHHIIHSKTIEGNSHFLKSATHKPVM